VSIYIVNDTPHETRRAH